MPPGSLAIGGIALKIPGGKFSWVSQLVRTRRPIRSGWRVTSTCDIAPPESLPTIVTSFEVERLEEARDDRRDPVGGEVGIGLHRDLLGADRPVGGEAAVAVGEAVDDAVPEPAVDQVAVDEDDRLALAGLAVADRSGGQVDLAALV